MNKSKKPSVKARHGNAIRRGGRMPQTLKLASSSSLSQVEEETSKPTVKVTLLISEPVVIEAKKLAIDQRTTLSKLFEKSVKAELENTIPRN